MEPKRDGWEGSNVSRGRVFLVVALVAAALVDGARLTGLPESIEANMILLRLNKEACSGGCMDHRLTALLRSERFQTANARVAWLGGLCLAQGAGTYAAGERLWKMAPEYAARMLAARAETARNGTEKLDLARTAIRLNPSSVPVRRALAEALVANEDWAEAASLLDALLIEVPGDADLNALRGLAEYKSGGDEQVARRYLTQAVALDGKSVRAHLYLTEFLRSYGSGAENEEALLSALATFQGSPYRLVFAGWLIDHYLREGQLSKIAPHLEPALGVEPQHAWLNALAGQYYLRLGAYSQAVQHLRIALTTAQEPAYYLYLGDSYLALGKRDDAIKAYCGALSIGGSYAKASERLSELGARCE